MRCGHPPCGVHRLAGFPRGARFNHGPRNTRGTRMSRCPRERLPGGLLGGGGSRGVGAFTRGERGAGARAQPGKGRAGGRDAEASLPDTEQQSPACGNGPVLQACHRKATYPSPPEGHLAAEFGWTLLFSQVTRFGQLRAAGRLPIKIPASGLSPHTEPGDPRGP